MRKNQLNRRENRHKYLNRKKINSLKNYKLKKMSPLNRSLFKNKILLNLKKMIVNPKKNKKGRNKKRLNKRNKKMKILQGQWVSYLLVLNTTMKIINTIIQIIRNSIVLSVYWFKKEMIKYPILNHWKDAFLKSFKMFRTWLMMLKLIKICLKIKEKILK